MASPNTSSSTLDGQAEATSGSDKSSSVKMTSLIPVFKELLDFFVVEGEQVYVGVHFFKLFKIYSVHFNSTSLRMLMRTVLLVSVASLKQSPNWNSRYQLATQMKGELGLQKAFTFASPFY